MAIERWSDSVLLVELQNEPALTDDLTALLDQLAGNRSAHVVMNLAHVTYLNSSNLAKLLKVRKTVQTSSGRLVLCGIDATVWGIFLVTGLDKVFEFTEDVATALASVQLNG
ncbi:MAG TPA: STAS domain-containing protein [Phycisphaerae bacterium]|nr:STAS domain-containing protein [Phycisphaerae bacterium]HNU45419.1 STAS domain-containing protein [Phycisphaerae bacterium]